MLFKTGKEGGQGDYKTVHFYTEFFQFTYYLLQD